MTISQFTDIFTSCIPYTPNQQQSALIAALARFCSSATRPESVFILNGYAGTGKTSIVAALVKALEAVKVPVALMAPTGRAAKVFGNMARSRAFTIHRRIYRLDAEGGVSVTANSRPGTIFIVDEASMISDDHAGGRPGLLEDLVHYAFAGADGCKMILLGDSAQLPPVGSDNSPALDVRRLKALGLNVSRAVITDTMRQGRRSGILRNATWLRRAMLVDPLPEPKLFIGRYDDVRAVDPADLPDAIAASYSDVGRDETIVITRSNRRATAFNLAIRSTILDYDTELTRGERLLVAKNNYHWTAGVKGLDFIANGDMAVVDRVIATETRYDMRWADVAITLPDRDASIDCKIMLEPLTTELPALAPERMTRLISCRIASPDFAAYGASDSAVNRALRSDPYVNALQVKYGYALTCHKAQGGQWADVYVDMDYIPPEAMGLDFYRWLYTATTRATRTLYYIAPSLDINPA